MTNPLSLSTVFLIALLMTLAGTGCGYFVGHSQGVDQERGEENADSVKQLGGMVTSFSKLIADSNAASAAMRQALNDRKKVDMSTTQELKNVLSKTANSRADCRFDDDVMRSLTEARSRAATSASGGIRGAVSGTDSTNR